VFDFYLAATESLFPVTHKQSYGEGKLRCPYQLLKAKDTKAMNKLTYAQNMSTNKKLINELFYQFMYTGSTTLLKE